MIRIWQDMYVFAGFRLWSYHIYFQALSPQATMLAARSAPNDWSPTGVRKGRCPPGHDQIQASCESCVSFSVSSIPSNPLRFDETSVHICAFYSSLLSLLLSYLIYPSIYLSAFLSACLCVYLSTVCIFLSFFLSIDLSTYLSILITTKLLYSILSF